MSQVHRMEVSHEGRRPSMYEGGLVRLGGRLMYVGTVCRKEV